MVLVVETVMMLVEAISEDTTVDVAVAGAIWSRLWQKGTPEGSATSWVAGADEQKAIEMVEDGV